MPRDVRMRGFDRRDDVDDVVARIAAHAVKTGTEEVSVTDAVGRVLATSIDAPIDVPPFDRSAMDGYALKGEETFGASTMQPLPFRVIGEATPGHPFDGVVNAGEAVRIMTGAPVPDGADAVLMAEEVDGEGDRVHAIGSVAPKKNVGRRGEDVARGARLLDQGRRLRPQDAAVLASVGVARASVIRRPRVIVLITGDELLPPGSTPEGSKIVDTNSIVLRALIERDGGIADVSPILRDDREVVRRALVDADADVVLCSGGSSVGSEDHAPTLVAEHGELISHGVALRPASPAGFGRIGDKLVFLIPGNPVSCLCAYEFFAGPAIRRAGGLPAEWPHRRARLKTRRKIASAIGRVDYVRVRIVDGEVEPIATAGASILSSTCRADGVVLMKKESEGVGEGEEVEVLLYDG